MGDLYGGGGSGGKRGDLYGSGGGAGVGPPPTPSKKPSGHPHGVGGFFHNLYGDVKSSVYGAPGFVTQAAEATYHDLRRNPWLALEGPAFPLWEAGLGATGHPSELYNTIEKPLVQQTAYTWSPLAHGNVGETLSRIEEHPTSLLDLAAGVGIAGRGLRVAGLLREAPTSIELRSPGALAGREEAKVITRQVVGGDIARRLKIGADEALKRLPPDMRVLGENTRYARAVRQTGDKAQAGLVLKARHYVPAEAKLSKAERVAANLIHDYPTKALLRDYRARLAAEHPDSPTLRVLDNPKILAKFDNPTKKMRVYLEQSAGLGQEGAKILGLGDTEQRVFLPALLARGAKFEGDTLVAPGRRTIPGMIAEIKTEAAAEGRPLPIYRPHVSVEDARGTAVGSGGSAAQRYPVRQNHGVLAAAGRVAYDINTLTPSFMRTVKWAVYTDRHADLLASAVKVAKEEGLRPGNVYVKTSLSERIPYTERTTAQFEKRLGELVPAPEDTRGGQLADELTTTHEQDALTDENGFRYQVPERVAKQITGEFTRSSKAASWLWEKPLAVWRALVLNLRVGWLVNNVVGNTFLYLIKNAGPAGLRAYLRALSDIKGPAAVRKLIVGDKEVTSHLTPDDLAEILPEQVAGTFFGTQRPGVGKFGRTRVGKALTGIPKGLQSADVAYEQALRRAMVNKLIRTNPEFKRFYKKLPRETRNFRQAAKDFAADNPQMVERVSKQVNDTLGDFFSMSHFERTVLRGVAPFYAWYRAITLIAVKLPVDSPIRAAILLKLGQVGDEYTQDYGLPYLKGAVPVGDLLLKTQGVNPLTTPFQTAEAVTSGARAFAGIPGADPNAALNFQGMLNPFLAALFESVGAAARGDSTPRGTGLVGIFRGLPEVQIAAPFPSKLYQGDPRQRTILSYLGAPVVKVNQAEAKKRAGR